MARMKYSREFKIQAVKRVEEDIIPSAQVAREYIASLIGYFSVAVGLVVYM